MQRTDSHDNQRRFDWPRAAQLAALRDAALPPVTLPDGSTVSAVLLKAVLRVLDDHGRGKEAYLKHETIAREAGCSERQAKRATTALEQLSLVVKERRRIGYGRASCNHFVIVWNELELRVPHERRRTPPAAADSSAAREHEPRRTPPPAVTSADSSAPDKYQSANRDDQSANLTDQSAIYGTYRRSALKRTKEPPPPTAPKKEVRVQGSVVATERGAVGIPGKNPGEVVVERLAQLGLADARTAVSQALANGVTLAELAALVAHYETKPGAWGPGALHFRIRTAVAGQAAQQGWPPLAAAYAAHQQRERLQRAAEVSAQQGAAFRLVVSGRRAGASEEAIRERLAAAGLVWPGEVEREHVRESHRPEKSF